MSWRRRRLGPSEVGSVRLVEKPGDWLLYSRSVCYRFASATARSYHLGRCRAEQERKWNDIYTAFSQFPTIADSEYGCVYS